MILAILTTVFWDIVVFLICYFGIRDHYDLYDEFIVSFIKYKLNELKENNYPDIDDYIILTDEALTEYKNDCAIIKKRISDRTTASWQALGLLLPAVLFSLLVVHLNQHIIILLLSFVSLFINFLFSSTYKPKSKTETRLKNIKNDIHKTGNPVDILRLTKELWFTVNYKRSRGSDGVAYTNVTIGCSIVYSIVLFIFLYIIIKHLL